MRKVVRGRYERKTLQDEALCRLRLKSRSYVQDTRREPAGTRTGENRVKGTVEGGGRERGCRAILHRTLQAIVRWGITEQDYHLEGPLWLSYAGGQGRKH